MIESIFYRLSSLTIDSDNKEVNRMTSFRHVSDLAINSFLKSLIRLLWYRLVWW